MRQNGKTSALELQRRDRQRAMSIANFCESYGVGGSTTYQQIKLKRLRAVKCGKRTIITEEDAEDWLHSLRTSIPDEPSNDQPAAEIEA